MNSVVPDNKPAARSRVSVDLKTWGPFIALLALAVLGLGAAYGLGAAARGFWLEEFAAVQLTGAAVVVG